ncbi:MAG: MoaD/ThiS family protein [Thermoplasmata archaeon]|nr:MoaD/ThiS family protein [Thermoplasmata archaeon]
MAAVRLDGMLRQFVPHLEVTTKAPSVEALLDELETKYPRLRLRLRDETGAVRRFVRIFVNGEEIRHLNGLETPVAGQDRVDILHSIQGG